MAIMLELVKIVSDQCQEKYIGKGFQFLMTSCIHQGWSRTAMYFVVRLYHLH